VSSITTDIEKAFLQNDPEILRTLIAPGSFINLYFAEPIVFSDLLSDEQAYLWFRRFFRSYKTLGFYPDPEGILLRSLDRGSFIFKARWEIQTQDRPQLALDVLFYFRLRSQERNLKGSWSILQIRAEPQIRPERR